MKSHVRTLAPVLITFFAVTGAQTVNAQIINAIQAHVDHSFVIGDRIVPPGEYAFRMTTDPVQSLMIATGQNGTHVARFLVRNPSTTTGLVIRNSFFTSMEILSF